VVETNVLLTVVGMCDCGLYKQVVYVVLDDCFASVILGRKPKSEQGQGQGGRGRSGAGPWGLAHDCSILVADTVVASR
jgi:hypothetical protein